jgi:predicted membrane protein
MGSGVVVIGSPDFSFETTTGAVEMNIVLPSGVGGSIEADVGTGSVDIDAPGWTEITSKHYESSDYDTASQTVTIVVQTGTGAVEADIS